MAKEISELSGKTTPVGTDEIEIQETGGGTSKKATLTNVWANQASPTATSGDSTISNGNLVIGTSGKGNDFSATGDGLETMTSELLDDYEEGNFTVICTLAAGSGTITYGRQFGSYTKVGNRVFYDIDFQTTSLASRTGELKIEGLPYANNASRFSVGHIGFATGLALPAADFMGLVTNTSEATLSPYLMVDQWLTSSIITHTEWTANARIIAGGHYYV